jgi:hypothetical protein
VKTIADALGIACQIWWRRQLLARRTAVGGARHEPELLTKIGHVIAGQPTYRYGRLHAPMRNGTARRRAAFNVKRVYRVMNVHGIFPKATSRGS